MTRIGELGADEVARRLAYEGIVVRTGPFATAVASDVASVAAAVHEHYANHRLADNDAIVDLTVRVGMVRRHVLSSRRLVGATVDGMNPFPDAPPHHAVPMLETAMNYGIAILGLDVLMLHAGVVERDGRALILPGQSGSGKSTLSAALCHRGWRLLSDELALVAVTDGSVVPLVRPISLKNESIAALARFAPDAAIGRRYEGTAKGTIAYCRPPRASVELEDASARPAWLVFPTFGGTGPTDATPVDRALTFARSLGHAVNYRRLGQAGFTTLADLAEGCAAYALTFRDLDEGVACIERLTRAP